jgi:GntR family transcriptional regulator, carbon starvation induced regulator
MPGATLHDQSDRYRRIFLKKHAPDRNVPAEHTALAHAAIERRARDATRILREHIERTGRNIQAPLQLSTK